MDVNRISQVFGVRKDMVLSYIERDEVDGRFINSLSSDKHIVIYGASKQGKSALVKKHLNHDDYLTVNCSTQMATSDIYKSVLRQINVEIETSYENTNGCKGEIQSKAGFKAKLPFIGQADAEVQGTAGTESEIKVSSKTIEFNLEIAQDICEILDDCRFKKWILIENFHYLQNDVQKLFAVDLRIFQDMGYKFIVLGIWRERNRLLQFNGDLMDRLVEIPVEPWKKTDFDAVVKKGMKELKIEISEEIIEEVESIGFQNIGIVQELLNKICNFACRDNIKVQRIDDNKYLHDAIAVKIEDYSASHMRSFESIAASSQYKNGLYMPYYLIKIIVSYNVDKLVNGIPKNELHHLFTEVHKKEVRTSDITYLLNNLAKLQLKCQISPPLFDYDANGRKLRVIDSTLLFFLRFKDSKEIMEDISNPLELSTISE